MKKKFTFLMAAVMLLMMMGLPGNAAGQNRGYAIAYTLNPKQGSDNGYATSEDIVIGGITWNVTGNSTMVPWRIGGKNLSGVDRAVYSKTALNKKITKVVIHHGNASSVTVHSVKLIVSSAQNGGGTKISELTSSFTANDSVVFTKPAQDGDWSNAYYKIIYNVTIGGSNKFIEFKKVTFHKTTHIITYDATNGGITGVDANDGSVTTGASIGEGETVTLTATPNPGYRFDGWGVSGTGATLSSTGSNPALFTMGTADATVTASFVSDAPTYTITAQSNNNSFGTVSLSGSTITATPANNYRVSTSTPYSVSPVNSATVVQDGNTFTVTPSANTTVTINFEAIPTHTATFSVNGNTTSSQVVEGVSITFPDDPADINGKTFVGWTANAITGISQDAPAYVTSATMGTNDLTFYAVFANSATSQGTVEHELTITASTLTYLEASYGNHSNTIQVEGNDYTIDYNACKQNEKIQLRNNSTISYLYFPTLPGDIKRVYSTNCSNGNGDANYTGTIHLKTTKTQGNTNTDDITRTTLNSVNEFSISMPEENKAFYFLTSAGLRLSNLTVVYEVSGETTTYSNYCTTVPSQDIWFVTYDGNGSDGGTVPTDDTEYNTDNNKVTVLGNTGGLYKTGYTFSGWNTANDGTGTNYAANATFTIAANTILYAKWTINSYSCTLNVIGDDDDAEAALKVDGSAAGATIQYSKEVTVEVETSTGFVYSISVKDANNNDITVANNKFTMPASNVTVTVTTAENPTYTLVTSTDQLVPGKHYIIATSNVAGSAFAISSLNGTYRDRVSVTVSESSDNKKYIEYVEGLYEFVLSGDGDNKWSIFDEANSAYLYGGSKGTLGNTATLDNTAKWDITIDGNAAIKNNEFYIEHNSSATRFACYAGTQGDVYLYVKNSDNNCHIYSNTNLSSDMTVAGNMEIHAGVVTVKEDKTLTVGGALTNAVAANLIIENGGQLICNNSVAATVQKSIDTWTTVDGKAANWYFIASPIVSVDGIAPGNVTGMITDATGAGEGDHTYDLYSLDVNYPKEEWRNYRNHNFKLANGMGYLYASQEGTTLGFSGEILPSNSGKTVSDLTANDFNLVGNPYTCEAYVNQPYFTLNQVEDGDFSPATATLSSTAIQPCTGIVVKPESTSVKFSKDYPVTSSNNGNVQLVLAQNVATRGESTAKTLDNAIISFNEGSQLGKFYFGSQDANLYIPMDNEEYAIVSSSAQGEMPVNFKAHRDGQYTITVNPQEVEMGCLHLIDNIGGKDIDLLATPSYTFNAKADDYESRFRLVFSANMVNADLDDDFAFFSNGQLVIANEGESLLQLIDVNGRIVMTESVNGTCSKAINVKAGVYVLRLIQGTDVKTQKIIVK